MCTYLKNMEGKKPKDFKNKFFDSIQKMFNRAFKRVNTFVDFRTDLVEGSSKRSGEELEQESTKKQKVDKDKDTTELQSLMEVIPDKEEVAIDVVPLATKPPTIVDWKIHKEGKKSYYQIVRADGKSKMYKVFSLMLKSFSREDLEDLYKLVKAKYKSTRPVEDLDVVLWSDLNTMFEPHVEDEIWKLQQRIKSLLNAVSITAALIDVNATQSKLVLLENFNENYSMCLRLLYKVNVAERVNAVSEEVSTAELACSFMLCNLDFEPLSLSLSFMLSCDLMSLTNMLILLHYLESFKSELAEFWMKALKLQFSLVSTEASGFESMFSIPSSTINLLKVCSSRGLVKISCITRLFEIAIALVLSQNMGTFSYMMS
ncbi:hypothetical protein Tco_0697561 [Tanacetum coccineum]